MRESLREWEIAMCRFYLILVRFVLVAVPLPAPVLAQTARPAVRQSEPWFLIAPLEATCLPPRDVFDRADTPEAVAGQLTGDGRRYTVHYDRGQAARSDVATLKDSHGQGGDVVLVRGKEACLLALKKRMGG